MSIGYMSDISPKAKTTPTASSPQLAAAKPAPEFIVCTRFWRSRLRNFDIHAIGTRAMAIAIKAPMTEVLGVVPILAIICIQITADKIEIITLTKNVSGSKALTDSCFFSAIFFPPLDV